MAQTLVTTPTVVVVDDDVDAAETLAAILENHGFSVETAYDGAEGLNLVDTIAPDAVVSDLEMPRMTGLEEAQAIRELPTVKRPWLVAMTGRHTAHSEAEALEAGFDFYLPKPVPLGDLIRLLDRCIGRFGVAQ